MNTESCRGLRAKLPILDDYCLASLDEICEIINGSTIRVKEQKETIKFIGDSICIE